MKRVAVLGCVLAIVIPGSISADCYKDHSDSKVYKYIPGLMELHFSDLDTNGDDQISMKEFSSRLTTSGESAFKYQDRDSSCYHRSISDPPNAGFLTHLTGGKFLPEQ